MEIAHDAADQVNAEAADAVRVGRRRAGRIEGPAAVAELHPDAAAVRFQPDPDRLLHPLAPPVPHGVGEQLFQRQVQIILDFGAERTLAAEALQFLRQARQFVQAAVQF